MIETMLMTQENCCSKCAATGKTCCQQTEIYVTLGDVKRIAGHISRLDFFENRKPADPAYLAAEEDPAWQRYVFRLDGTRRVLRQHSSGDCTFLTARGCLLSLEVRPLVCRLYPLTYTAAGVQPAPDERCPASRICSGRTVLEIFGLQLQTILQWHADLYSEMMDPEGGATDENWIDLRPAV